MKKTLVILSDYTRIGKANDRLFLENHKKEESIPLTLIDGIIIYGKASFTSDALSLCAKYKIPVCFVSKYGYIKGYFLPCFLSSANKKRLFQYELYLNKKLFIAKKIVMAKIFEIQEVFEINLSELTPAIQKAKDYSTLLGLEGVASKEMFDKFSEIIKDKGWNFKGRSYKPPKDKVNALLSIVYTICYSLSIALIVFNGLDPYISFLHIKRGKHASFASDVMEVVRPYLTMFVAKVIESGNIKKTDFIKKDSGYLLNKASFSSLLQEFEGIKEDVVNKMKKFLKNFDI